MKIKLPKFSREQNKIALMVKAHGLKHIQPMLGKAVAKRIWRRSPLGFTHQGKVILGRDYEEGSYTYDDLITVGYISSDAITDLIRGKVYKLK